jgi:hypothetical protein
MFRSTVFTLGKLGKPRMKADAVNVPRKADFWAEMSDLSEVHPLRIHCVLGVINVGKRKRRWTIDDDDP